MRRVFCGECKWLVESSDDFGTSYKCVCPCNGFAEEVNPSWYSECTYRKPERPDIINKKNNCTWWKRRGKLHWLRKAWLEVRGCT